MQSKTDTVSLWFKWSECRTDPTPYKVYAPVLSPENVYVEINVPKIYVAHLQEGNVVLTLQGMAWVQSEIAKTISAKYSE